MAISEDKLRELIRAEEGQYHDRKSLFEGPRDQKRPRDRRAVRDQIAEYVAGFANAEGGVLICGVENDGCVTGHRYPPDVVEEMLRVPERRLLPALRPGALASIDGHEVLVFVVDGAARAVQVDGDGFPYRIGDTTRQFSEEKINSIKDLGLIESAEARPSRRTLADLDATLVNRAALAAGLAADPADYLIERRLADRHGGGLVLRLAAELLFASAPALIDHPNAGVRVFRVAGTRQETGARRNVQEFPRVEGNLPSVLERVRALLDTLIQKSTKLHDLFFQEMPEYPTVAWQEALVNAVAHRDYAVQGQSVEVWLFDDRLEVWSPGAQPAEVALDDLKAAAPTHVSRNPRIARVLTDLGVMRDQGEGIPRMFEEMEVSYLPLPEIDVVSRRFRVLLRNQPLFQVADAAWSQAVRALPLGVGQKRALVGLSDRDFANADYGALNGVDRDTAYRELADLLARGYLSTTGSGAGTRYRVVREAVASASIGPVARLAARMADAGFITNADYRDAFGVSRSAAKNALSAWVAASFLVLEGEKRSSRYLPGPAWPPPA